MVARRRRVVWTLGAQRELDEAVAHIAAEAPQAARGTLGRILDGAGSLATLSERGRVVPEREDPMVRELLIDPFRLLYSIGDEEVVVLGLIHQRQDFDRSRHAR